MSEDALNKKSACRLAVMLLVSIPPTVSNYPASMMSEEAVSMFVHLFVVIHKLDQRDVL